MSETHTKNSVVATILLLTIVLTGCQRQLLSTTVASQTGTGAVLTGSQVLLSWKANAGEQDYFVIEQSIDNVNFTQITSVPDGTTHTTVGGLAPGQAYFFRIKGHNQAGDSPYAPVAAVQ